MSKQTDAKLAQGYVRQAIPKVCSNCRHYRSVTTLREGVFGGIYTDESKKRCGLGGFAVMKMGSCSFHANPDEAKS